MLAGAGDKAFCTGGDQSAHEGQYDGRGTIGLPMEELQAVIRDVPKPVIARVQGFAIGGGNVLATICDLTIAARQGGVRPGRPEGRFGRSGLWHGLSRARRRREEGARDVVSVPPLHRRGKPLAMGLVNTVVPHDELDAEVARWCAEIMRAQPDGASRSPSALSTWTPSIMRGIAGMGM